MSNQTSGNAARIGAALANVARGAAQGGLHGAAIGAVESFLPQLLKLAAILLCTLLFLPFLVIAALPNILFGFPSSATPDIVAMNDQAALVSAAYQEVDAATNDRISEILELAKGANIGEDGASAFEEVAVEQNTDNTNIYWFVAISSVAHEQDLFTMSVQAIRDLVVSKLTWTTSIFTQIVDAGDSIAHIRTLRVNITDLEPEALMDKLLFTEEEKNWARTLYASMMDTQFVDTEGVGGGLELEDMTFTDAEVPVVYYSQLDARWCNTMYGKSGTIGEAGCGPTALAMVVASLAEPGVTPVDTAQWSVKSGHRAEGNGSYHSIIPDGAEHYGLNVEGIGRDAKKLVQALEDGKLVVALMSRGHFTRGGHFIVLRGVTAEGKILVADSASVKRSNQTWDLSIFPAEARMNAEAGGPFWVISA